MWTLPNILTIARIAMIPIIVGLFFIPYEWAAWAALGVYTLACITDFLDGYLARKRQEFSAIGKFLDPIADKLLIATLLMMLVGFERLDGFWIIPAVLILFREIAVAGLREFLGPVNIQLPVSHLAKWKTTIQMVALGFLIVGDYGNHIVPETLFVGQIGVSIAAVLTVITGYQYLKAGIAHILKMD
jgi:cardiolipin synthase